MEQEAEKIKVKIIKVQTEIQDLGCGYSDCYGEEDSSIVIDAILEKTEWEEITQKDYDFLWENLRHLNKRGRRYGVYIMVRDQSVNTVLQTTTEWYKKEIAKNKKENKKREEQETRDKEKRARAKENREKKKLAQLKKKYDIPKT